MAKALCYLELFFSSLATLCLVLLVFAQVDSTINRQTALDAFDEALVAILAEFPDRSLWSEPRIEAYEASAMTPVDVPQGVLRIPAIDFSVPIFEGTSDLTLNRGVGRIEGTAQLGAAGNLGIAGHRDGYFRGLKSLDVGDVVEVQTLQGSVKYRVLELLIVEPSDIHVLEPTEETTLTLVTCYPFYFLGHAPQRYIVRAVVDQLATTLSEFETSSIEGDEDV